MKAKRRKNNQGCFFSSDTMLENKKSSYSLNKKLVQIYIRLSNLYNKWKPNKTADLLLKLFLQIL